MQRVGIGYDIHAFSEEKKLVLGGVEIPYKKGLEGHSDADVLLHALCDAILGAMGQGDIGEHFPNTDEAYRNISSLVLLEQVMAIVKKEQYKINNADMVIQAEEPHIKEFKPKMRKTIAQYLGVEENAVNIKATTQERLGAIGQGKGIAAFATVLLTK